MSGSTEQGPAPHRYGDIEEADNPMPGWWLTTFFGLITFATVYYYRDQVFHVMPTPMEELAQDQDALRSQSGKTAPPTAQALLELRADPRAVADGAATFQTLCSTCHGEKAEGKIGPNLTDRYWLHGGKPSEIFETVSHGVADKGMPAWAQALGPTKTEHVVAFVLAQRNKDVPGKDKQGVEDTED